MDKAAIIDEVLERARTYPAESAREWAIGGGQSRWDEIPREIALTAG